MTTPTAKRIHTSVMGGTYFRPSLMATKEAPQNSTVKSAFIEALKVFFMIYPIGIKIPPLIKAGAP
jgi:hypothetical protein